MPNTISDGAYRFINVGTGEHMLAIVPTSTSAGERVGNGTKTNIIAPTDEEYDAMTFVVSTRSDGTRRIQNRLTGKTLIAENGSTSAGTPIVLWEEQEDFDGQEFVITPTGNTSSQEDTYYISPASDTSKAWDYVYVGDSSNYGWVRLGSKSSPNSSRSNEWYVITADFNPALCEIRSMLDKDNLALDIVNWSVANGTNVQLNALNYSNSQRWRLVYEGTGTSYPGHTSLGKYALVCLHSGKYMDVAWGTAAHGTNVQVFSDNGSDAQRWNMLYEGSATVDGKGCRVVRFGSYVTSDGNTYCLDVANAQANPQANVQIATNVDHPCQKFALVPTSPGDINMPVPYEFGVRKTPYGFAWLDSEGQIYNLGWKCSDLWAVDGFARHFEIRSRRRYKNPSTSTWGTWSEWSDWLPAPAIVKNSNAYMPDPITDEFSWNTATVAQHEYQLRTAVKIADDSYTTGNIVHGQYIDETITVYKKPDVSITDISWTPEGLILGYTSDYPYGSTYINVSRIEDANTQQVIYDGGYSGIRLSNVGSPASVEIAADKLASFPTDGQNLRIYYSVGYDLCESFGVEEAVITCHYNAGTTSISLSFMDVGNRLIGIAQNLGTARMWVQFENTMYECELAPDYDSSYFYFFEVRYPMGMPFDVYVLTYNGDRTTWGSKKISLPEQNIHAHAFDLDSGETIYITQFASGAEQYSASAEAVYSADILDNRKHESVSFGNAVKKSFSVSGLLADDYTLSDMDKLVGQHALYRSPNGGMYEVAITRYTATAHNGYTEVSIDLIEETR